MATYMNRWRRVAQWGALTLGVIMLSACGGGGDSSVTTVSGPGLSSLGASPPVSLFTTLMPFVQKSNNLKVEVNGGPLRAFSLGGSANILYAEVKVCELPDPHPSNLSTPPKCVTIPNVLVDTGSVGLRVFAKSVTDAGLVLSPVSTPEGGEAWECYAFVIGGLWGRNAVADVTLGQQVAQNIPIQLIQNDVGPAAPADCVTKADGTTVDIMSSVDQLGANGILGIGDTEIDCGIGCVDYYNCPANATATAVCAVTALGVAFQVYNPVAAFPIHNNGVVLALPAVPFPGAVTATGELIFGIDTSNADTGAANNMRPSAAATVQLGTTYPSNSYLNITTTYNGLPPLTNSYLDTGTNGLFFSDNIRLCPVDPSQPPSPWYCPIDASNRAISLVTHASLSDGDNPSQNQTVVLFTVENADALFSTTNTAFGGLAGAPPPGPSAGTTFAWGLPFFYGRRVFLSIWQPSKAGGPSSPPCSPGKPCYAWETL